MAASIDRGSLATSTRAWLRFCTCTLEHHVTRRGAAARYFDDPVMVIDAIHIETMYIYIIKASRCCRSFVNCLVLCAIVCPRQRRTQSEPQECVRPHSIHYMLRQELQRSRWQSLQTHVSRGDTCESEVSPLLKLYLLNETSAKPPLRSKTRAWRQALLQSRCIGPSVNYIV